MPSEKFFVGQTVVGYVLDKTAENHQFSLSLKRSLCETTGGEEGDSVVNQLERVRLSHLFSEMDRFVKSKKGVDWTKYRPMKIVSASVTQIESIGHILSLPDDGLTGFAHVQQTEGAALTLLSLSPFRLFLR